MLLKTLVQRKSLLPPSPLGFQMKSLNSLSPLGRFTQPLGQNLYTDDSTFPLIQNSEKSLNNSNFAEDIASSLTSSELTSDIQKPENQDISSDYKNSNVTETEWDKPHSLQRKEFPLELNISLPEKSSNTNLQKSGYLENQIYSNNQCVNNAEAIRENSNLDFTTQIDDELTVTSDRDVETTTQPLFTNTNLPETLKSLKPLSQNTDFYISRFVSDYLLNKPGAYSSALLQNKNHQIVDNLQNNEIEYTQQINQQKTQLETEKSDTETKSPLDLLSINKETEILAEDNQINFQLKPSSDTLLNTPNQQSSTPIKNNSEDENRATTFNNPSRIQPKLQLPNQDTPSDSLKIDTSQEKNSLLEQSNHIQPQILPSNHQQAKLSTQKTNIDSSSDVIPQNTQLTEKEIPSNHLTRETIPLQQQAINKKTLDTTPQQQEIFQKSNTVEPKAVSPQVAPHKINLDSNISPEILHQKAKDTNETSPANFTEENIQSQKQNISQNIIQQKSELPISEEIQRTLNKLPLPVYKNNLEPHLNKDYQNSEKSIKSFLESPVQDNNQNNNYKNTPSSKSIQTNLEKSNDDNFNLPTSITRKELQKPENNSSAKNNQIESNHLSSKSNYSHLPPLSKLSPLVKESDLQLTQFVNESANLSTCFSDNQQLNEENNLLFQKTAENQINQNTTTNDNQIDLSLKADNNQTSLIQHAENDSDINSPLNNIKPNNNDIPDSWSDISELLSNTSPETNLQTHNFSNINNHATNLFENISEEQDAHQYINTPQQEDLQVNRKETNYTPDQNIADSWSNISELIGEIATTSEISQQENNKLTFSPPSESKEKVVSSEKFANIQSQKITDEDLEILAHQIYKIIRQKLENDRESQGISLLGYPEWLNIIPVNLSIGSYQTINQIDLLDENMNILAREVYNLISIRLHTERERYSYSYAFANR
ncbi:hypothetical protein NIES267_10100 [Calothrix parasitica NIES-267]|uniref:Uncharacterized protein n=1 Tax=Calothrix parasitica NIES-267 TaxID=1973488 RepID=A0A1Z4LJW7_9CYAN|nr:hypothetical protein NIES267_10100 [Calothrix parasitica NIES-267]